MLRRLAGKLAPSMARQQKNNRMHQADAVVKIGGSVFIEYTGWENVPIEIPNPHYFIIGANFGPYRTEKFFSAKKQNILQSDDCCFRDQYSYRLFRDVPQVRYAPDTLWAYPHYPAVQKGSGVGISILNLSAFSGLEDQTEAYERGIARICDQHIGAGNKVVLYGFCKTDGDEAAIKRITSYCSSPQQIDAEIYDGDICGFLDAFNRVETVYASRFHAMILGFAMRKKVIPITYSIKQINALEDIGFKGVYWNILDREHLSEKVIRGEAEVLSDTILTDYQERAKEQFRGLDRFLCADD